MRARWACSGSTSGYSRKSAICCRLIVGFVTGDIGLGYRFDSGIAVVFNHVTVDIGERRHHHQHFADVEGVPDFLATE